MHASQAAYLFPVPSRRSGAFTGKLNHMNKSSFSVGQPFNPFRLFYGAFIPNWLLCRKEISQGAKLCYARLGQYSGENGICNPRQSTVADDLGVSERQVNAYISELCKFRLLTTKRNGLGQSNSYSFIWHEWITQDTSDQSRSILRVRTEEDCASDTKDTSVPCIEENHRRESFNKEKALPELSLPESFSSKPSSLPETLDVPEFRKAWDEWKAYLREIRRTMTNSTQKMVLGDCESWGVSASIDSIKNSIRAKYPALYPMKTAQKPTVAAKDKYKNGF